MPQITLLSQDTIDKIAAGEVIERPCSVEKSWLKMRLMLEQQPSLLKLKKVGSHLSA